MRFLPVLAGCLLAMGAWAEDSNVTLVIDGVTYSDVRFETNTATSVKIRHASGVARVPLAKLPADLQARFNYPPKKAAPPVTNLPLVVEASSTNPPAMGTMAYLDWRYGFRDLTFGQTIEGAKGFAGVTNLNYGSKVFVREEENLSLGAAKLKRIVYNVYEEKLVGVEVQFAPAGVEIIVGILSEAYGKGTDVNGEVVWVGEKVQAKLSRAANQFTMESKKLALEQLEGVAAKKEAEERAKLKEAAKQL